MGAVLNLLFGNKQNYTLFWIPYVHNREKISCPMYKRLFSVDVAVFTAVLSTTKTFLSTV